MEALGLVLAAVFVLLGVIYLYLENRQLPPGPYGVPLFGYMPFLGKCLHMGLTNLRKKYGNVISVRLGTRMVVVLNDFEAVTQALIVQANTFSGRLTKRFTDISDKDILLSDGPEWKERKRYAMRALSDLGVGRSSSECNIVDEVDKLTDYLKANNGQPIEMMELFFLPVLNITCNIAYGRRYERDDSEVELIKDTLTNIQFPTRSTKFLSMLEKIFGKSFRIGSKQFTDYLNNVIDLHENDPNVNEPNNLTSKYLAEMRRTERMNSTQLAAFKRSYLFGLLTDIMVAGVDTSESTLLWSLLYVALNPEVQRKVQRELDGLMTNDSALPMNSKKLAPYTEATIMEVHRCASVVPLALPHRALRNTLLLGQPIKADFVVIANLHAVHNDERHFGDPSVFRPERFLNADGQVITDDHLMPFSKGPRQCMGIALAKMTVFIFFTCILRRFTFSMVEGQPKPSLEPRSGSAVAKPKPFSLIVTCRD